MSTVLVFGTAGRGYFACVIINRMVPVARRAVPTEMRPDSASLPVAGIFREHVKISCKLMVGKVRFEYWRGI